MTAHTDQGSVGSPILLKGNFQFGYLKVCESEFVGFPQVENF